MESRIVITRALFDKALEHSRLTVINKSNPDDLWAWLALQLSTPYGIDVATVAMRKYLGYKDADI